MTSCEYPVKDQVSVEGSLAMRNDEVYSFVIRYEITLLKNYDEEKGSRHWWIGAILAKVTETTCTFAF